MMTSFMMGLALMLILEGILPFLSPRCWRRIVQQLAMQTDKILHLWGLLSMLAGVILLYWVH